MQLSKATTENPALLVPRYAFIVNPVTVIVGMSWSGTLTVMKPAGISGNAVRMRRDCRPRRK
jgi:hypothetical protein